MSGILHSAKVFFGFIREEAQPEEPVITSSKPVAAKGFKGRLIHMPSTSQVKSSEIKVLEPRTYEDSLNIASFLREGKPVIVNLKYLDTNSSKRLIDFVCGTAYAINGHMLKVGENIFLFTPESIQISDNEDKSTLEQGLDNAEKDFFFKRQVAAQ